MDIGTMVLRSLFVYLLLLLFVHSIERKEIGKSLLPDLVFIIMVVQLAAPSMISTNTPMLETLVPVVFLFLTRWLLVSLSHLFKRWQITISKGQKRMSAQYPILLIINGELQEENLKKLGKTYFWLKTELKKRTGTSAFKQISLCRLLTDGYWHIDIKEQQRHKK